ncbi:hypothetical protein [Peribacillus acanthi]|uniref:hypothetical protein n=1 Tax=Peribacillus acanthi TaxID=2171554 RepID=UPI000D3E3664|nr:hypothetical protein [Peribacillus acanthi]
MTVQEIYEKAVSSPYWELQLLIEFLVHEKKVLEFTDDEEKLQFYFQDRFNTQMNEHIKQYKRLREGGKRAH